MSSCSICHRSNPILYTCQLCEGPVYCGSKCANQGWYVGEHYKHHAEHLVDQVISQSSEGLGAVWIGSADILSDDSFIEQNHICAVLSVITKDSLSDDYIYAHIPKSILHMRIPIRDYPTEPLERYLDQGADFIDSNRHCGGGVLVHCRGGISRSVSIVIYYMHKYLGYTVDAALAKIRESRPAARPNEGFMNKLYRIT